VYNRHNEIMMLEKRPAEQVLATHYNHVQRALKKLGTEIRLQIPKLKHLDLILQKNAWIVVDRVLNDLPIVCWTEFEVQHRNNLHEPIHCELRLYHYAAEMILGRTLEAMELMLGESLVSDTEQISVIPFPEA
jgi:hypothetical protein